MVVGELSLKCDLAVLGAGPGGYVAAIRAAELGKDVVLIENEKLGGVCLHHGCIPSKALIRVSELKHEMERASEIGLEIGTITVDFKKTQEWKNKVVNKLTKGIESLCKKLGIEIIKGRGYFVSSNKINVAQEHGLTGVEFDKAILATGSKPRELKGLEFDNDKIISSRKALQLEKIPKSLTVVGGGYIGIEIGTFYAKLGSNVSIIQRSDILLRGTDPELVRVVEKKLTKLGIKIHFNSKITNVEKNENLKLEVTKKDGEKFSLETEKVLVAIGRKLDFTDLGLEKTKVTFDEKGFIKVNHERKTEDQNIYAVGDITGKPLLAHKAFMEGKVAAEVIAGKKSSFDVTAIPAVVFSDPEIASVGLNEKEANLRGIETIVGKFPFKANGRALTMNKSEGFAKVIAQKNDQRILGVHIVGAEASNLIGEAGLAVEMGALLEDLALTIHPHPTLTEIVGEVTESALGKSVHFIPFIKKN